MWWFMIFLGNMKMKGPSFPSHSLSQIGFNKFFRNGSKTPNFPSWSNSYNRILKFLQDTLGTMKSFATTAIYI